MGHEASSSGFASPYAAFRENSRDKIREDETAGNSIFSMSAQAETGCVEWRVHEMGDVAVLRPGEVVRQDVEAIAAVYRNLGAPVAEQVVARALGELALTMAGIAEKVQAQDLRDLARHLVRLGRLSSDLGLLSLASVAGDAKTCLERADCTAFLAVWARLLRVAERSLAAGTGKTDHSV